MFIATSSGPRPKCYVSHGLLPLNLRSKKVPRAKKPFSSILANPWYHTVDLILPEELLLLVQDSLDRESRSLDYCRVHMKLEELIDGDFFNMYIKTGNIEMLSQGSPSLETQYSLREGILRLDMPKHIFQRLGLDGRPISSGGRKHVVSRMRVEINLRLPSMVSGRKGFERIRWAFKNVLKESVTWLFRDIASQNSQEPNDPTTITPSLNQPISKLHPVSRSAHPPTQTLLENTLVPPLSPPPRSPLQSSTSYLRSDTCIDTLECISLIANHSPRIRSTDTIDPFLCRYSLPTPFPDETEARQRTNTTPTPISSNPTTQSSPTQTITTLRWHGFIPASWLLSLVLGCVTELQGSNEAWFALSANAMVTEAGRDRRDGLCLLMFPRAKSAGIIPDNPATGRSDDEMDVADGEGGDGGASEQAAGKEGTAGAELATSRRRDFVVWDFVDCVSER